MDMDELVVAIRVTAEQAMQEIERLTDEMKEIAESAENVKKKGDKAFDPMEKGAREAGKAIEDVKKKGEGAFDPMEKGAREAGKAIEDIKKKGEGAFDPMEKGAREAGKAIEDIKKKGEGAFDPMTKSAQDAAAAQAALAAASTAVMAAITRAVRGGVAAFNEYTAATKGLESVASGRGINSGAMTRALDEVTDEFLNASAAATAYKNLLTRGFTLDQAATTINRLKDAATYGRAANLSLEEAVVSATEGLRQENSVLVDNAGVTKNVAKMWEEYAKARGLTAASLTQAQKVEAEYQGILAETESQVGDLAKASNTLAGAQAENAAAAKGLAIEYGEALAPGMKLVTEYGTSFMEIMGAMVQGAPQVASGLTAAAGAMALYATGTKAAAAAQALMAAGTGVISGPMLALGAAVGIAAAAYTKYKKAQEDAAQAQTEAAQAAEEERKAQEQKVTDLQEQEKTLASLGKEYERLTKLEFRSQRQNERLDSIMETLVTQYGISETALDGLAGAYDSGNDAIVDRLTLLRQEILLERAKAELMDKTAQLEQAVAAESQAVSRSQQLGKLVQGMFMMPEFNEQKDEWITALGEWLNDMLDKFGELDFDEDVFRQLIDAQSAEEAKSIMWSYFDTIEAEAISAREGTNALREEVELLNEALENPDAFDWDKLYGTGSGTEGEGGSGDDGEKTAYETAMEGVQAYRDQLDAIVANQEAIEDLMTLKSEDATLTEKQTAALNLQREGYGYLLGDVKAIDAAMKSAMTESSELFKGYMDARADLIEEKYALTSAYEAGEVTFSEYKSGLAEIDAALAQTKEGALEAAKAMNKTEDALDDSGDEFSKLKKEAESTGKKLEDALNFKAEIRSMKALARQVKDTGGSWDDLSEEVKAFGQQMGVAEGDLDGTIAALEGMEAQTDTSAQGMVTELQGILGTLETMRAELMSIPPAELTADASQAMSEINALIALINFVLSLAGKAGISLDGTGTKRKSGGGGGSSKKADAEHEAEEAARKAQQAQEEAYRAEIERIEHRRTLGQITAQEEIEELERVKREYAKTAEQIMDIDERIYEARQELREKEEDKITTLHDAIVDALEARYEEQREIEQKRISDSIAAWEKWSDDTCAAIQKQIDALDEQAEAEDRAATEAEHLRKIAGLEQAILYETDEYDVKQLQKQLGQAQAAWADVQKGWAVEDQRAALEEQMQAVQDQADAEVEALEKESERIDSVYDEMIKGQSLAAEAQKVLMQSTQEEMLTLLSSYAPEYEATGRTLGEKIYEGFKKAFGDITAFFAQIDAQFEEMTTQAQKAAFGTTSSLQQSGQTAANVNSPTINQTVNFNQPVESPADVTRRMQRVSEELAGMM